MRRCDPFCKHFLFNSTAMPAIQSLEKPPQHTLGLVRRRLQDLATLVADDFAAALVHLESIDGGCIALVGARHFAL